MLEEYFVRPDTVDRIRTSWIGPGVECYVAWLAGQGYRPRTVLHRVPLLLGFAEARGLQEDTMVPRERPVRRFIEFTNEYPWNWGVRRPLLSINLSIFVDCLLEVSTPLTRQCAAGAAPRRPAHVLARGDREEAMHSEGPVAGEAAPSVETAETQEYAASCW